MFNNYVLDRKILLIMEMLLKSNNKLSHDERGEKITSKKRRESSDVEENDVGLECGKGVGRCPNTLTPHKNNARSKGCR